MTDAVSHVKASVVIPTKNAGVQLRGVLDAVLNQQTAWPYEILVIDSGSTDGTVDLVKSYSSVRFVQIPPREFGHGRTRNFAIAQTSGVYIAMLTQDALPTGPCWLKELVEAIEVDSQIAGVFGRHIAYPGASPFTRQELEQHFLGFEQQPVVGLDDRIRYESDEGYRRFLYFFSDNNALLRRTVWLEIPYPDVEFAEDQAWARLIIEAGYRKGYAHKAVVCHSHNYGFIERLQRSFDESWALSRLFHYQHGRRLHHAAKSFIGITLRDCRYAFRSRLFTKGFHEVVCMVADNFMRAGGHYLGMNANKMPEFIRVRLSRDRRLMMM